MIGVLWCYDGWYSATFCAGEMRDPRRSLPRGMLMARSSRPCSTSWSIWFTSAPCPPDLGRSTGIGVAAATACWRAICRTGDACRLYIGLWVPFRERADRGANLPADGAGRTLFPCSGKDPSGTPYAQRLHRGPGCWSSCWRFPGRTNSWDLCHLCNVHVPHRNGRRPFVLRRQRPNILAVPCLGLSVDAHRVHPCLVRVCG